MMKFEYYYGIDNSKYIHQGINVFLDFLKWYKYLYVNI